MTPEEARRATPYSGYAIFRNSAYPAPPHVPVSLRYIERYERFAAAKRKAHEAMDYIDLKSGELRTGEQARSLLETAADEMQSIDHTKSKGLPAISAIGYRDCHWPSPICMPACKRLSPAIPPKPSGLLASSCIWPAWCKSAPCLYRSRTDHATCLALPLGSRTYLAKKPMNC